MKKDNKGFSLVELIIVIAIMAVLVGLLAPQYLRFVKKSKVDTDVTNGQEIASAFNVAFADGKISDDTYDSIPDGVNMTEFPESKVNEDYTWEVVVGLNGVSSVTLGGDQVYPTSEEYYDANPYE